MQWVAQYGYVAIFSLLVLGIIGLPIPDETLLLFVGYLIYKGQLRPIPSLASAFLGSLCGITLSYAVGRTFGLYVIRKYGRYVRVTDERMKRVHRWFQQMGRWALTFGYYVPGVRHLTAYVAGASKLELPVFALFAYSGGLLWSGTFIGLGYALGQRWSHVGLGQLHLALTAAVALILIFAYIWYRRRGSA
ncbi:MAG TPA: DedA family protein [Vicinamibacteria bacterium]|nr:DedA family protein [Vicinamibacteria bacterium]